MAIRFVPSRLRPYTCGVIVLALLTGGAAAADVAVLRPSEGGEVRAVVIGIDAYQFVPKLRGAVADARDLENTLRSNGVTDLTALYDAAADRETVLRTLGGLLVRTKPGDLIVLTIAGHGVQEPEHVKGSQPDGFDNVFVLAAFNPRTAPGSEQRIIGTEFNHMIKEFEARGARVVFVADACHGGGLAREVDSRAPEMSYRQAPRYALAGDDLKLISTASDAFLTEFDFKRTEFLAAVDRKTKAPEVRVPGVAGYRGALSYAVARAFEGAADENNDGVVTQRELFNYVRQVAYQLSDQRQNVVTVGPADVSPDIVFTRAHNAIAAADIGYRTRGAVLSSSTTTSSPPVAVPPLDVVRIAVLGDRRDLIGNLEARAARFEVVDPNDSPDLVWDPTSRVVLAGADVVAPKIDRSDLPSVIDRMAAVNGFKRLAASGPQSVRLLPDDQIDRRDARIEVLVSDLQRRSLLMFNIAGDGTVQMLYPMGLDSRVLSSADYSFRVRVDQPFGADLVVAITSAERLDDLEQALHRFNQRRTAAEVLALIERQAPADARIGATALYTAP